MFGTERDGDWSRSPDGCSAAVEVSLCSICPADMDRFSSRHFLLAWPLARRFPSWRFSGRTPSIAVRAPRFSIGGAGADDQLGGGKRTRRDFVLGERLSDGAPGVSLLAVA